MRDYSVYKMNLKTRTRNSLLENYINTIGNVFDMGPTALLDIEGIGDTAITNIRKFFESKNLTWSDK